MMNLITKFFNLFIKEIKIMFENEYYYNCYNLLIKKKPIHFIIIFFDYLITLIAQITLYTIQFSYKLDEELPSKFFYAILIQQINKSPEYFKLLIIIILFILIFVYFFIYTKFTFGNKYIFSVIVINIFEIIIFRILFIFVLHLLLAINGILLIIMIVVSIPVIFLIMQNFTLNHLYYFSPHFVVYPYDYYSSTNEIFHLVEKIFLSIALQSSIINLNVFLYICTFILQICNFVFSSYIFYYRSYYIMNNIFLNKTRFSFLASSFAINLILILFGAKNYMSHTFLIFYINIYLGIYLFVQIFYNPYKYSYFSTDDKIENLYFYYFIIDHLRNDSFLLEEKVRQHFNKCQKCNLCRNLKEYLSKKKCYKKVYKILYNKIGVLEQTINELIHIVLVKGKESLKYNSFYLINLMYCYYININKKNYVLSLNLKLIFEIINDKNKNILENHLLSTEQILLINEFLSKADNILDKMQIILKETINKEKVRHFFALYEVLFELKSKKFKSKLYYNKNEGIINFYQLISICSMIYEEIFNISLSNGGLSLKENQIFLDDISHKNNSILNQLIIQLDLLNFENKIIYITGELAKYKGKALCQLFPNIFKTKQLALMKNKIMSSKFLTFINKDKDFFENNNKGKNNEQQFINLQLLIYDEFEHSKYYVMLSLRLNLIFPLKISKKILLTGFYSVEKNIIITLDKSTNENKKEIVLNSENHKLESGLKNYSSNEVELIKYKNDSKYYNNKKLLFVTKFYVNPNCYNIYSFFQTEKQRTYKMDKIINGIQKNNNLYDIESKNNIYAGAESTMQNFNFLMQQSQASSTFSQTTGDTKNFRKREKGGKKDNRKTQKFRYYQIGLLFFVFIIFLLQIIIHLTLNNSLKHINNQNMALMMLKNYYGIFNTMFTSILSISCLSESERGDDCQNLVSFYSEKFLLEQNGHALNLTQYLFGQNQFTCYQLSAIRQRILQILSNSDDETLNDLVNSEMTTLIISQDIAQNETKLMANKQSNSFIDVLNYMTTGLIVINSNEKNLKDIVYILNKINNNKNWTSTDEPFIYVKLKGQLTQYQNYYYYLILNYQQFLQRLDKISDNLIGSTSKIVLKNISSMKLIVLIILLTQILLQFIIYLYIQSYFKILAELLNDIEKKMDIKNEEISVREMFLQKIEKLKTIISLYKQDIYQAIVDLNFIYDNYKKLVEEKNKEMAKYLKKEKIFNEKSYFVIDKNKKIARKHISEINTNRIYLYYIIFFAFISIIISIILFIMWDSYASIYEKIINLVKIHGNLSNDAYKTINYYQLMIYDSIHFEDINAYERLNNLKGEDLLSRIYTDIEELYEAKKYMNKLKQYNLDDLDKYFNFTCESFFEQIFTTNGWAARGYNLKYKPIFIHICKDGNIFKTNDYKQIFTLLFEMLQIGMNQINNHTYEGLIHIKKTEHFVKTTSIFLFIYYYTFEILGLQIQRQSYQKLSQLIDSYLHIGFIIYYFSSLVFIFVIISIYIFKFNKNYNYLHEMKKVFKICNKSE